MKWLPFLILLTHWNYFLQYHPSMWWWCNQMHTHTLQCELLLCGGGQHNSRDKAGAGKLGCDLAAVTEGWVFPALSLHLQKRRILSHNNVSQACLKTLYPLHTGSCVFSFPPLLLIFWSRCVCACVSKCVCVCRHTCHDAHTEIRTQP